MATTLSISAFPGGGTDVHKPGPVAAGTVIQFEARLDDKLAVDVPIRWVITGPFAHAHQEVDVIGSTYDWDTQGLRAGAYSIVATCADTAVVASAAPADAYDPLTATAEAAEEHPTDGPAGTGAAGELVSNRVVLVLTPGTGAMNNEGVVPVSLQRTAMVETPQQVLWVIIRNRTNAIGWRRYKEFIDSVMCGDGRSGVSWSNGHIPFRGTDAYTILKNATDLFLMHEAGVIRSGFEIGEPFTREHLGPLDSEAALDEIAGLNTAERETWRLAEGRRSVNNASVERLRVLRDGYYEQLNDENVLPYLRIIRDRLSDIPLKGEGETPPSCYGILKSNLGGPVAMELIWSYWHEEGMLVQTLNAILARFQNRRSTIGRGPDPLSRFDLDPLRPLNNLFWGWAQDEIFRLTVKRRAFEYEHEYGLRLIGKAVPQDPVLDRRSKFLESFHNLLNLTHVFYKEDDDTTVIADAFPVLNALRETHLILAEGAHNQFGDMPSLARSEMLVMEWLLARPEIREFLGGRIMVPYEEEWMDRVDMMKTMQGWTDSTITHFRDLGVYGEQLLLSIRYGNWSVENDPQEAANWARYWRPEVQRYAHAYRSATGIDLTERVDTTMPATLLQRRLVQQRRA